MGVRESLLNTITSVADSDFVRIVTSAGASSKATVKNLFKGFESNLGAKSSLTTSDYIRVVGSDNVSYKQSVNNVKDAFGLNFIALTSGSLLTWAEGLADGEWHFRTNDAVSGTPTGYLLGVVYVKDGNRRILAYKMTSEGRWTNFRTNGLNWAGWEKLPTRAEIDALNSKTVKTKTVTGTTTTTGAISMGLSIDSVKVLDIRIKNPRVGYVFQRGDDYATVFTVTDNAMTILPNTSVTIDIFYVEI